MAPQATRKVKKKDKGKKRKDRVDVGGPSMDDNEAAMVVDQALASQPVNMQDDDFWKDLDDYDVGAAPAGPAGEDPPVVATGGNGEENVGVILENTEETPIKETSAATSGEAPEPPKDKNAIIWNFRDIEAVIVCSQFLDDHLAVLNNLRHSLWLAHESLMRSRVLALKALEALNHVAYARKMAMDMTVDDSNEG
ncbi:hypothetical protein DFP72DRAFT_1079872 [Ephemerocybe angulata]|uniref:Uncharacterized protein n=1 Tax=Ephemerocybe angulata TaxID=980116 RepID=A0A8H6HCF6_9AGAR|nr:hypothetical protein DFP72DRAFT_1079872 [Tulosesus angulatus]